MLGIKCLRTMPLEFVDQLDTSSRAEWDSMSEKDRALIFNMSSGAWLMSKNGVPLLIIGVIRTSLIGTGAEVWFMCFKEMRKHLKEVLRFCRKGRDRLRRCYGALKVRHEAGQRTNERFIQHFDFTRVGDTGVCPDGKRYTVYVLGA